MNEQKQIKLEELKKAQRQHPDSEATHALQSAYARQQNEIVAARRAAESLAQDAEDRAQEKRLRIVDYRDQVEIVSGPYPDLATRYNIWDALRRRGEISVAIAEPVVKDGEHVMDVVGEVRPARILDARQGAHWSDQPHGESGWYVIYTVELPEDLRELRVMGEAVKYQEVMS